MSEQGCVHMCVCVCVVREGGQRCTVQRKVREGGRETAQERTDGQRWGDRNSIQRDVERQRIRRM